MNSDLPVRLEVSAAWRWASAAQRHGMVMVLRAPGAAEAGVARVLASLGCPRIDVNAEAPGKERTTGQSMYLPDWP